MTPKPEWKSMWQTLFTLLSFQILTIYGRIKDFIETIKSLIFICDEKENDEEKSFPPLYGHHDFAAFFAKHIYAKIGDCFNRPLVSAPGPQILIAERKHSLDLSGHLIKAINMGSCNYLGYARPENIHKNSSLHLNHIGTCSSRVEFGSLESQLRMEKRLATFLGVEATLTFGMGFATNATNIGALVDRQCLILSDQFNHVSLVLGARLSGAIIQTFKHNDMNDLETKLRHALVYGHTVTRRAWKKILILVEGIYSMEGDMCPLPTLIHLKRKYKAYLYVDEAHSIGALGATGRGIVEHYGCDPRNIDVLMGTFTKSFASSGGYIGGSLSLINYLKHKSHAHCYASSMCSIVCTKITNILEEFLQLSNNPSDSMLNIRLRLDSLRENTMYFRARLKNLGFCVLGEDKSPVVPCLIHVPSKNIYFNRLMLSRGVACVSVGYPATPLTKWRVRFCITAAHTRKMLDYVLNEMETFAKQIGI